MKIAILFDRLGPYHVARIRGAMAFAEVLAVEGAPHRAVYDWTAPDLPDGLEHVILAADKSQETAAEIIERRLDEVVAQFEPDAIALPGWSTMITLVTLRWSRRHGIPAICMSETNAWDFKRQPITEAVKRGIVAHYQAGLATNSSQIDYLKQLGICPTSIFSGYNAIDNEYFGRAAAHWREESALPHGIRHLIPSAGKGRYFLASNRFVPKKNLIRLLEAYSAFRFGRTNDPADWPLVLLGGGEMQEQIEIKVAELGIGSHVHMPGFLQVDELVQYYGTAGGFIHASTTEQWGLVINEAMAAGLVVAASRRCGATQYLVEDGVTGFQFDPFETSQITQAFEKIADARGNVSIIEAAQRKVDELSPKNFGQALTFAARAAKACKRRAGFFDRLALDLAIIRALRSERS